MRQLTHSDIEVAYAACVRTAEPLLAEKVVHQEDVTLEPAPGLFEQWVICFTTGLVPPHGILDGGRILIDVKSPCALDPWPVVTGLLWVTDHGKKKITHICVDSAMRRRGVGRVLIEAYRRYISAKVEFVGPYSEAGEAFVRRVKSETLNGFEGATHSKVTYDRTVGALRVNGMPIPAGYAIRLGRLGRLEGTDVLAHLVPERLTHIFALHPLAWEHTFWSLTNKDRRKIIHYKPTLVPIRPGTLVAEMALYNAVEQGESRAAQEYVESVRPVEEVDVRTYRMPELLIPRE